jgi:hypothetical protein
VPYGFEPHLSAEVGSGTAMCPMAPDLASRLRWALMLSRALWLRTSPPSRGGIRHCHVSHGSLWTVSFKYKEKPSRPACTARHACSQRTRTRYKGASRQCHHAPARRAGRQCSQYLQGVWTVTYSAATIRLQCNVDTMDHSSGTATVPK